jgi:hypothetical protein
VEKMSAAMATRFIFPSLGYGRHSNVPPFLLSTGGAARLPDVARHSTGR